MLRSVDVKGYGSIRHTRVELTPLHAFVGPNDSGKTTLLESLALVWNRFVANDSAAVTRRNKAVRIRLEATIGASETGSEFRLVAGSDANGNLDHTARWYGPGVGNQPRSIPQGIIEAFGWRKARLVRLEADALKKPSAYLTPNELASFVEKRGEGLPGVLDAVLGRGDDSYSRLQARVRALFPGVTRLQLEATTSSTKRLLVHIAGSSEPVPAEHASEGLLYFIAYLALQEVTQSAILLVEEPENGLHPSRIRDVVGVLREISKAGTQVVMATHSPLVINELEPEEVSVVTRSVEAGTQVTPMKQTRDFERRSKVYALGELWLSYCDGDTEGRLVGGPERDE